MAIRYEKPKGPRFTMVFENGREEVRVPARRNWLVIIFLPLWLIPWTIGGIVAMYELVTTHEPFIALWLCFWTVGWIFAAGAVAWTMAGLEFVRVLGRDLEIGYRLFRFERSKGYRGEAIGALGVAAGSDPLRRFRPSLPFVTALRFGAVKFDYGARTVFFADGLDEAEGRMIVEWLRPRLPAGASA
jgi:hypothetical protein